ncbi:unnamed protein product [Adineta ricciae]|uniref:Uncharacterized protein n=1 Tax=Adineta ricciae TaxID=249248 RepID=A0A815RQC7_ADIRI|nr:unnamed protein product [Adineta ricciae]
MLQAILPRRNKNMHFFNVYKLLPTPLFYQNETIQLAQVPRYWAINLVDNSTMEWNNPEESGRNLEIKTSCQSSPPIQSILEKTSFGQIMKGLPLLDCQVTFVPPAPFFLRQLRDNLWVTSSSEPFHCLMIPGSEYSTLRQQAWNSNQHITLPLIALVNVTPGYTIACPGYTLVGNPIPSTITRIFRNDLTLEFLSPEDLNIIVFDVLQHGNLTFNSHYGALPMVQIVTNLLVRQQLDFVSSSQYTPTNPHEIGRLIITSYFAVPQQKHSFFNVYKLLPIPFFYQNETIQLAQVPRYWAINLVDNSTMEWNNPEESGCNLQIMTSCRSTPPIQSISEKTCFGQIIKGLPLLDCHVTFVPPAPFFLRQLRDNLWVTSSSEPFHCLMIPGAEYSTLRQQAWNSNQHITLPPIALVNVTPGYTIACPGYTLVGNPIPSSSPSLVIRYNSSFLMNNISIVNVYKHLHENTSWFNTKPSDKRIDNIIKRMRESMTNTPNELYYPTHARFSSASIVNWILLALVSGVVAYYIYQHKRKTILGSI